MKAPGQLPLIMSTMLVLTRHLNPRWSGKSMHSKLYYILNICNIDRSKKLHELKNVDSISGKDLFACTGTSICRGKQSFRLMVL